MCYVCSYLHYFLFCFVLCLSYLSGIIINADKHRCDCVGTKMYRNKKDQERKTGKGLECTNSTVFPSLIWYLITFQNPVRDPLPASERASLVLKVLSQEEYWERYLTSGYHALRVERKWRMVLYLKNKMAAVFPCKISQTLDVKSYLNEYPGDAFDFLLPYLYFCASVFCFWDSVSV